MEILSVALKNFKAHRDRQFKFCPGTNAICGENGAGKTSILEAIAWTLFNYRGSYRKDDLVRNGCRSAQVTVQFISSRDQRTYSIQRCTSKGYTLFDPQLNQRLPYNRIDEEVVPWLREHLGVVAGTDLPRLFENTIGVPQGMLTADFLLSGERRKRVFDTILKVEEYKETAKGLGDLQRYADGKVQTLQRDLSHYDGMLQQRPEMESRYHQVQQTIQHNEAKLAQLEQQLTLLQRQQAELEAQAQGVQSLAQQLQNLTLQLDSAQRELALREEAVVQAQQAVQVCTAHQVGYQHYQESEARLKELQTQQQERMRLWQQRQTLDQQRAIAEQRLATLTEKLHQIEQAEQTMASLQPAVERQTELEVEKRAVELQLQNLQRWGMEQETLTAHLQRLRQDWQQQAQAIKRIEALETDVLAIPTLEHQRDRLQAQLSRVEVAKQFETEFREIVTQVTTQRDRQSALVQSTIERLQQALTHHLSSDLSSVLHTTVTLLQSGGSLTTDVTQRLQEILTDLAQQVSATQIKQQQREISDRLHQSYQYQGEWSHLEEQRERLAQIKAEGKQTQDKINQLTSQLTQQEAVQGQYVQLSETLKALNDPRQQCQLLQGQLSQKSSLLQQRESLEQELTAHRTATQQVDEQLRQFQALDDQIAKWEVLRQTHHPSYLTYLKYQQTAEQLATGQAKVVESQRTIDRLSTEKEVVQKQYTQATATYDPRILEQVNQELISVRSGRDQLQGSLPEQRRLLSELEYRRTELTTMVAQRDRTQTELGTTQSNHDFISFARHAYKEAGPRITERYVQVISKEANRLFRELLNRQNVALEWTRDYEIIIQEGPHTRRFINLSGGEQMCAALAVRLALLRVLADIDIAFFDEPTTNMDRTRRESLGEAIANLKTFHQLFVISHDDTFEQFTEHVILVKRESEEMENN